MNHKKLSYIIAGLIVIGYITFMVGLGYLIVIEAEEQSQETTQISRQWSKSDRILKLDHSVVM